MRAIGTVVLSLLIGACAAPGPPLSPEAAVASPTSSLSAAAAVPMSPNLCQGGNRILPGGIAVVRAETVARQGPGVQYEPTAAATVGVSLSARAEPYGFARDDRLVVSEGPLRVDGADWYLVYSTDARGIVSQGTTVPTSDAWVAASLDGTAQLEPLDAEAVPCHFIAAGSAGSSAVDIPSAECLSGELCAAAALSWAAAAPPQGTCRLRVTDNGTGEVIVDESVTDWSIGASWWFGRDARLIVETTCAWSLRTAEG